MVNTPISSGTRPTNDEQSNQEQIDRAYEIRYREAIKYCDEMIDWYATLKRRQRLQYQALQFLTIVLGAITPVLILAGERVDPLLQAIPPAIAAVAAALNASFNYRENWARFANTLELLKIEKPKFITRTTKDYNLDLSDDIALDYFVTNILNFIQIQKHEGMVHMCAVSAARRCAVRPVRPPGSARRTARWYGRTTSSQRMGDVVPTLIACLTVMLAWAPESSVVI